MPQLGARKPDTHDSGDEFVVTGYGTNRTVRSVQSRPADVGADVIGRPGQAVPQGQVVPIIMAPGIRYLSDQLLGMGHIGDIRCKERDPRGTKKLSFKKKGPH